MNSKSNILVDGNAALDGILTAWYFEGAGAADPINFSGNIESVSRFTSDGGQDVYRVRFCDPTPYSGTCAVGESYAVTQSELLDLRAVRSLDSLDSAVAPQADREIDIIVRVANAGASTNSIGTGQYVKSIAFLDMSDPG
jgi:hypothetical protein